MMSDYPSSIIYFYKNTSVENYIKVRHYIDLKIKTKTYKYKTHYTLFLHVIHMKYPGYEDSYVSTGCCCFAKKRNYMYEVNCSGIYSHLMGNPVLLSITDIELLWLCFYATGDTIYSDQVKICALTKKHTLVSDAVTKTAAEWSYNNHVIQKFIKEPQISKINAVLSVHDPLFFCPNQEAIMEKYRDE
jgi:hypothetical protein